MMAERKFTGVFVELEKVSGDFPSEEKEYVPHMTILARWRVSDEEAKEECLSGQQAVARHLVKGTILKSDHTFISTYPQWKTGIPLTDVHLGMSPESLKMLNAARDDASKAATGKPYEWPFPDSPEIPQHIGIKYSFTSEKEAEAWRLQNCPKANVVWKVVRVTTACTKLDQS